MAETYKNEVADHADHDAGRAGGQILLTLLGGVLLIVAAVAYIWFPDGEPSVVENGASSVEVISRNFYAGLISIIAALTLATPLIYRALKDLWHGRTQMNALAALAVAAAIASGAYLTAGAIAFFMILSNLIETRTALGAR